VIILSLAIALTLAVLIFTLSVRVKDLPEVVPPSPFEHLDERKAQIYENLRDLQFEYRVGKLSDADYATTKAGLQRELAAVMAEIDKIKQELGPGTFTAAPAPVPAKPAKPAAPAPATVCPHCGAQFPQKLKFCGECGKPVEEGA
jgi:hypothetical protein